MKVKTIRITFINLLTSTLLPWCCIINVALCMNPPDQEEVRYPGYSSSPHLVSSHLVGTEKREKKVLRPLPIIPIEAQRNLAMR